MYLDLIRWGKKIGMPVFLHSVSESRKLFWGKTIAILFALAMVDPILIWASEMQISHWKTVVESSTKKFDGTRIGGLSGIFKEGDKFWVVSDDKGQNGDHRIYQFQINLTETDFTMTPTKMVKLRDSNGKKFGLKSLDLEGIVYWKNSFILANEGFMNENPRVFPSILHFSKIGQEIDSLILPDQILPEKTGPQTKGVQNNGSIEGLSFSPSGKVLWVALEQPLVQENPAWKLGMPGQSVFLKYKLQNQNWIVDSEWHYSFERPFLPSKESNIVLGQGVSDVLALSDDDLLVLERGVTTSGTEVTYKIQIFQASTKPLIGGPNKTLSKKQVFDFDHIKDKISDGKGLDNYEGLSWGPLINGKKSLLLVTDDNFSPMQRTLWTILKAD